MIYFTNVLSDLQSVLLIVPFHWGAGVGVPGLKVDWLSTKFSASLDPSLSVLMCRFVYVSVCLMVSVCDGIQVGVGMVQV